MLKPAYWRTVHGRAVYMDAYGPRVNGNWPGGGLAGAGSSAPGRSSAVYSGLTAMPSGVFHVSVSAGSLPLSSFVAISVHVSSACSAGAAGAAVDDDALLLLLAARVATHDVARHGDRRAAAFAARRRRCILILRRTDYCVLLLADFTRAAGLLIL